MRDSRMEATSEAAAAREPLAGCWWELLRARLTRLRGRVEASARGGGSRALGEETGSARQRASLAPPRCHRRGGKPQRSTLTKRSARALRTAESIVVVVLGEGSGGRFSSLPVLADFL